MCRFRVKQICTTVYCNAIYCLLQCSKTITVICQFPLGKILIYHMGHCKAMELTLFDTALSLWYSPIWSFSWASCSLVIDWFLSLAGHPVCYCLQTLCKWQNLLILIWNHYHWQYYFRYLPWLHVYIMEMCGVWKYICKTSFLERLLICNTYIGSFLSIYQTDIWIFMNMYKLTILKIFIRFLYTADTFQKKPSLTDILQTYMCYLLLLIIFLI